MEEPEIDEWFSEEKERLEERFYAEAQKDVAKAKERFDHDYRKLILNFQAKQEQSYDAAKRKAALQKPLARFKERRRLAAEAVRQWWQQRTLALKKWWFDRKVRRIIKDKSDL